MLRLVAQLCLIICNPMDCSPPGSSVHGILQAGILEWVAISFSRGSSRPRDSACISCTGRWIPHHLSHQGSAVCAKGAVYMGDVVDESGIEYVCVLVSPGLLEPAELPPTGQKEQHFILPQLWRPEIPDQVSAGLLLKAVEKRPPLPLPASGGCQRSLACSSIQSPSPSPGGRLLCVSVCSSVSCKETCHWIWHLPG